jgi:hypothetical protein
MYPDARGITPAECDAAQVTCAVTGIETALAIVAAEKK